MSPRAERTPDDPGDRWDTSHPVTSDDDLWYVDLPDGLMSVPRYYRPATVAEVNAEDPPRGLTSCCPFRTAAERAVSDEWVAIVPWPALPPIPDGLYGAELRAWHDHDRWAYTVATGGPSPEHDAAGCSWCPS